MSRISKKTRKVKKKLHVTILKMNSLRLMCRVMNSRYVNFDTSAPHVTSIYTWHCQPCTKVGASITDTDQIPPITVLLPLYALSQEYTRDRGKSRRGILGVFRCTVLCTKDILQFLRGVACSTHTAHVEENSSGLPHFDLLTTDGSDFSSLRGMWLGSLRHLH